MPEERRKIAKEIMVGQCKLSCPAIGNVVKFGEISLSKYETWLKRQNAFSERCRTNHEPAEYIRCSNMFEAVDPNPLHRKSAEK
jgi:hypothetical protein